MQSPFLRTFGVPLVLGAAGLCAFLLLSDAVSPRASVDMKLSRNEIMERAAHYLHDLGYEVQNLQQDCWLQFGGFDHMALQARYGTSTANAIARADSLPVHEWYVSWYDRTVSTRQNVETFAVWMGTSGKVYGFDHWIRDSVPRPSMTTPMALARAELFLAKQGIDLGQYDLKSSSDIQLSGRLDHKFTWRLRDTTKELMLWLRVQGDEVGGFASTLSASGDFQRRYSETSTLMTFVVFGSIAVLFLLFFYIVILFLRKYHEGEVGTRTALAVFLAMFLISLLISINQYPVIGTSAMVGDMNKFNVRIVMFVVSVFILQVFLSVMVFAAWSVGESSARAVWPSKLTGADSALARQFLTRDLGEGIIRGYGWGLAILGGFGVVMYALENFLHVYPLSQSLEAVPESTIPLFQVIGAALTTAILCEIVFRLFFLSFIREKTGKLWLGVVVSLVLWTIVGISMWDQPFGLLRPLYTAGTILLFGGAFTVLFLRYDLTTTFTANALIGALSISVPIYSSTGSHLQATKWILPVVLAVPFVVGVVGWARGKHFTFTHATLPEHIQRISERVRMQKELEIARSVQMSLLPKENPHRTGLDIAGICIPAMEVGGDYYDFINLGDRKIGIAIGDVSGKGVPAAIYMTLTKGILQSHAEENVSPRLVLSKVNTLMYRTIERNSFVSMFYAVLDTQERVIRFARAGQCPIILAHSSLAEGRFLTPKGMALGLEMGKVFDSVLEEQELPLQSGETLVFYTDGFTEARNKRGDEFGEDRLVKAVARRRERSAADVIRAIVEEVEAFAEGQPQHDDMTMVVVKVA
jgi:phosphoserine phosphatase RsbU/P